MTEIWKDIRGYEGLYQISDFGRVKSLKRTTTGKHIRKVPEKLIALNVNKDGYIQVNLWKDNKLKRYKTSQLVALNFIDNPNNKLTVNHKDGIKSNNNIENLEWMTIKENLRHAYDMQLKKPPSDYNKEMSRQYDIKHKSKSVNQIDLKSGNIIKTWFSMSDVSRSLNISVSCISKCCTGKFKQTNGFRFEYATAVVKNSPNHPQYISMCG